MSNQINRRAFLRSSALGAAGAAVPALLHADPHAPLPHRPASSVAPVRVRGLVRIGGAGAPRVAVSDGVDVVATDSEGRFELVASGLSPFVHISPPAGTRIPTNPSGTARLYAPIASDANGEMNVAFDLERLPGGDERHTMLLWADPQTANHRHMELLHAQTVPDATQLIRDLGDRHVFGISCGDIMSDDLSLYPEYERAITQLGVPFFQVVGNHDLNFDAPTTEGAISTFSRFFGPGHYSFNRGAVHYVVLNDVFYHGAGYLGYITREQLVWLENDLRLVQPGRPVIVAVHIPVMNTEYPRRRDSMALSSTVANREELYRLLEPYNATIVSGHMHENEHLEDGGCKHHVAGTVCGGWWSGPIGYDGTPNGYPVYDIDGEQITHRYKATGLPFSHQLRAYPRGAEPQAPDEIVANVWDWDPSWTVVWYEDGERRGEMARRIGVDPWAVERKAGPWLTGHLFYAPASASAREIVVEATDGNGNRYTARVGDAMPDPVGWG